MAETSGTTSENVNTNIDDVDKQKKQKEDDEAKNKLESTSTLDEQKETDNLHDIVSSLKSTNATKKSDPTSITPSSDNKNEEKKEETSNSTTDNQKKAQEDSKKDESTTANETTSANSSDSKKDNEKTTADNAFPIEKGDAQHLTVFQREKAKYFFKVNLDFENKEYVTWEDVEFYLLFHATTSGKEGSGDLEARLSRAARAFWEHVHDQVPLPDGKRDTLTLDQFLDTWASLIDYVVRTNQLPPIIQDLVKLGFELYSTDNKTIQPVAFVQLFQKMNLGRPYAIMAYKHLTEDGTKPLDADKVESLVKAVITSSDDEHDSHFLLPGFFKTIGNNKNNENKDEPSSPAPDTNKTESSDKPSPTSTSTPSSQPYAPPSPSSQGQKPTETSTSSQSQQQVGPSSSPAQDEKPAAPSSQPQQPQNGPTPSSTQGQKPPIPPSPSQTQQQNGPTPPSPKEQKPPGPSSTPQQSGPTSQNGANKPPTPTPPGGKSQQQQQPPAPPKKVSIQQEDESIRRLLHYYHIDDGDVVEILGGSPPRLVLVHPERPLPPYIQQNKQLLDRLHLESSATSPVQQNGSNGASTKPTTNGQSTETKPKVTLEERISSGEAQKGPTVPIRQEQKQDNSSSAAASGVRQVYPQLSEAQQEEQQKQAKLQASQPPKDEKKTTEEASKTNNESTTPKPDESNEKKDTNRDNEDRIVAAILKQITPIVEKRVAAELRRIHSGESDQDEDDGFVPFPFMFAGGSPFFVAPRGGPPPQGFEQQQQNGGDQQQEQQGNGPRGPGFDGPAGGQTFIPPPLLMAMMSDLARGGMGGDMSGFPPNMPPPHLGPGGAPIGVEGFMMFVDDDQMMGGPTGFPPRTGPRF